MSLLRETVKACQDRLEYLLYGISSSNQIHLAISKDEFTRRQQGFQDVEATLPKEFTSNDTSILDRMTAFAFGGRNPVAREADAGRNIVWFLDNTAYQPEANADASWEAEFIAAYFVKNSGRDLSHAISNIADKIGVDDGRLGDTESARKTIERRLQPFALNILPARYTYISLPDDEVHQLGPGDSSGISIQTIRDLGLPCDKSFAQSFPVEEKLAPYSSMVTYFAEPHGWTVISDIDDSIKTTMTSSPIGILQSTFYDQPTPIKGMPKLYQHIEKLLRPNWFYLSASPYTLYTFLRPFLWQHYPHGTLMLREASWQDLNGLLQSFTVGTAAYKSSQMEKVHSWFPLRKILCVGDSTQSDPEAYGDMYRRHPEWIKAIFIRKVTGVRGVNVTTKNSPERFEEAFKDIPRSIWRIFEAPDELQQTVQSLTTL